ncbi:MAG: AMP-binding protein [Paludibacteraceae bacterium]|nr:AMP-binding protein [Paludibacteraceae bacterium]
MTENYLNILAETIRNNWDQPALTDFYLTEDGKAQDTSRGNHYTYGEMYAEICSVAELLISLGLQKGDHIAICGSNSSHWVIAYLAIAKMQGISVLLMHSLTAEQKAQLLYFSDAKAIIIDRELWQEMQMQQLRHVIAMDDWALLSSSSSEILYEGYAIDRERISILQGSQDELQTICFTSGSTGKPKGVMLSFRNVSASSKGVADACVLHDNKKAVSFLPLSHAYVLGGQVLTPLSYGACIYSLRGLANPVQMFAAIAMIQPYAVFLVPMLVAKLGNERLRPLIQVLVKSLEYMVIGGADFPIETEKSLAAMRVPIAPGYGVTETAALISLSPFSQHRLGASGRVISTLQCRIAPNGEILVKGENVMLGYYKDPEATAAKIDKEGWLHTGDKGHLDEDGYLYVEGRLEQDIIVLPNGENIRPDNIESLINAMPEVSESLVLARDGRLVAIVVPQITNHKSQITNSDLRRSILRTVNPQLPLFSQLYDVEIIDTPLARTEKQTIKRYLYK